MSLAWSKKFLLVGLLLILSTGLWYVAAYSTPAAVAGAPTGAIVNRDPGSAQGPLTPSATSTRTPFPTSTPTPSVTPTPACGFFWRSVSVAGSLPSPNLLEDVDMLSVSDGWAVGSQGNSVHIERWNGSSWNPMPPPAGLLPYSTLHGVSVLSSNDAWAVGSQGSDSYASAQTLMLHWNGTQWSVVQSPSPGSSWNALYDVEALAPDDVWAVGVIDSGPSIIHWDGTAWTNFPVPITQSGPLRSIYAPGPNDIWAVGEGGPHVTQMNLLHWDGVAWRMIKSPSVPGHEDEGASLYGIHGLGPNDIWAVGDQGNEFPMTLHWNGSEWSAVPNAAPSFGWSTLMDVVAVTATEAWAVGFNDQGPIAVRWNGSSWAQVAIPNPGYVGGGVYGTRLLGLAATRPGDIWTTGFYQTASDYNTKKSFVGRYSDPCTTPANTPTPTSTSIPSCQGDWQKVSSPNAGLPGHPNVLLGVDARATDDIWAVGYYSDTLGVEQPLVQRWNGVQWATVPSPSVDRGRLYGVVAVSSNDAWAVGSYRTASDEERSLIMRWNGAVWATVPGPDLNSTYHNLRSVTAISASDVWAVGYYLPSGGMGRALALHWNGTQWSAVPTPVPTDYDDYTLVSVSALATDDVWAAGTRRDFATPKPLVMHWNGSAWALSQVTDPADYNTYESVLTGITAIGPNDVWAVGYQVTVALQVTRIALLLHWNGSQWTKPEKPSISGGGYLSGYSTVGGASFLRGVAARASNDVWAVGSYRQTTGSITQTLALQSNGAIWGTTGTVNDSASAWALQGLTVAGTDIWAVGYYEVDGVARTLVERYVSTCPQGGSTPTSTPTRTPTATITPTSCPVQFSDVPASGPGSTFYSFVRCLACRGIVSGYPCGGAGEPCNGSGDPYFRPGLNVTRGQISKMVALAANLSGPTGDQIFQDVQPGSTFYDPIQQIGSRGYIGGYPCGRPTEPCEEGNRPYFRPGVNTTRGQLAKIVSETARFDEAPGEQKFADVPGDSPFFAWINRLANRGVIGGYACGGPGEDCDDQALPFFRPNEYVTRGQTAKIVANTFFPNCQTPARR
ncbi:MAG TPA: S-layer homology domain-containing protein [Chloroflexia bacterium]